MQYGFRKKHWILLVLVIVVGGVVGFLQYPLAIKKPGLYYSVLAGGSLNKVIADLAQQKIIFFPQLFKVLAKLTIAPHQLQAGLYFIKADTNAWQLLRQFQSGAGIAYQQFTIVPGWSQEQLYIRLLSSASLKHTIVDLASFRATIREFVPKIDVPDNFFAPNTYYYQANTSDVELLARAYHLMYQQLMLAWQKRELDLPWRNPGEALIAASLVEKEAYLDWERPIIAGVLLNRLRAQMRLQFNSNANYTYLAQGLPPQAIAIPSMNSIIAVLHPTRHNYLYFIATGYGGHQFSCDFMQHRLTTVVQIYRRQGFFNGATNLARMTYFLSAWQKNVR